MYVSIMYKDPQVICFFPSIKLCKIAYNFNNIEAIFMLCTL